MTWQDAVFAAGSLVFIAALVPVVRAPHKPPLSASVPTALVLAAYTGVYASLSLWLALGTGAFTAGLWAVLAMQRARS